MHVEVDLNWFLQFIVTPFLVAFGLLQLVRNTASKYFVVDSNFESDYSFDRNKEKMPAPGCDASVPCAVCEQRGTKQCARCKMVKYCSEACQKSHWSEHKKKCNNLQLSRKANSMQSTSILRGRKVSLVPGVGSSKIFKDSKEILFPYEEFMELYNWDKPGFPPCGLLNCGNSCFANVVLQCLAFTRPLVAYLLEKGHRKECQHEDWCFLCEFQTHVERASRSLQPFSPINILSRLPNIGGNLGYGKQEDAHEFMRFAIDTMQSVCLDEFGGEKAVHPRSQETTLIQHIFGGHLQSQVICANCNNVSNQFENMMDLTVEIHGDAASLEECLDQFTAKEWLHGDNMYKCDGCNDYVMAWKRLAVRRAPNILTVALKRFQSGRFGKLNKRVTFPETLNLSPYMSESEDGNDVYKLYAVIVHVDMLNASYFGHYICYVKDFRGNWYRIDDCKVSRVDLDEVLSQGAYMLLYNRIHARPSCLLPAESVRKEEMENMKMEVHLSPNLPDNSPVGCLDSPVDSGLLASVNCSGPKISNGEEDLSFSTDSVDASGDIEMVDSEASPSIFKDVERLHSNGCFVAPEEVDSVAEQAHEPATGNISVICTSSQSEVYDIEPSAPMSDVENESGGSKDVNEGLLEISGEDYSNTQNHISEKDDTAHDVSAMAFTSDKAHDELKFTHLSMPQIVKSENNISSPRGIQDVARKSNGLSSSGAKLKPLLAPGFLGKCPRDKRVKKESIIEVASNGRLNSQTNEIIKSHLTCQNGYLFPDEEKHYSGRSCSSDNLDGQAGMFNNDTEMASVEPDMSISLENRVSSDPIAFCNGTKIGKTSEGLRRKRKSEKKQFLTAMTDWSKLPADVLGLIARQLHFVEDRLRFGLVCKSWRMVMLHTDRFSCSLLPWLMLTEKEESDTRRVYSPFNKKVYELSLPEINGRRCWGSPHGWLVTLDVAFNMNLLNPLSRVQIFLPPLHKCSNLENLVCCPETFRNTFVYKAVLSSDPSSANCVVLAIYSDNKMAFAKPGDVAWTPLQSGSSFVNDVICFGGNFYAIDSSGDIRISDSKGSHLKTISLPVQEVDNELGENSIYLVEVGGHIHVVQRIMYDTKIYDLPVLRTWNFVIFRVDVCNGKWEEVKSLGDWSIFIGSNHSFSISASDYPECLRNCIYFTDDYSGLYYNTTTYLTYDIGTYDLDGPKIRTFLQEDVSRFKFSLPVWIKPSVSSTPLQNLQQTQKPIGAASESLAGANKLSM
ncbi:unnamed protein product [Fraxinus pennsylvanica]|uniref:Uncharacterized protein n=1 Tax=Fraxinus pennsylvanica TaxID=56036 RepID=A0AAD1YRD4_9LAMI|nr:unnamed protein product [Fraxinus pennsylvanica]